MISTHRLYKFGVIAALEMSDVPVFEFERKVDKEYTLIFFQ
jgi:hypothetical protein